jgi:hypothetical protein
MEQKEPRTTGDEGARPSFCALPPGPVTTVQEKLSSHLWIREANPQFISEAPIPSTDFQSLSSAAPRFLFCFFYILNFQVRQGKTAMKPTGGQEKGPSSCSGQRDSPFG